MALPIVQPRSGARSRRLSRALERLSLGRFELAVGAVLALLSAAMLLDSLQLMLRTGGVMWGSDTPVVGDTAQYLALVWDASGDLLIGNPFDGVPDEGGTLHPGWFATGLLHTLGVSTTLALLLFKPVALVLVFLGAHLYTRRLFEERFRRRVALVLGLFLLSPVAAGILLADLAQGGLGAFGSDGRQLVSLSRELYPLAQLWGYYWAAITIGLMPLALLAYERARASGSWRWLAAAALATALGSWLHPWQGATLMITVAAAELVRRRRPPLRETARRLVPYLAIGGAPMVYLFLLTKLDDQSARLAALLDGGFWPPHVIAAALVPVVLPALLAYRVPARDFQARAVRWWLPAGLFVYVQPAGTFRNHAVEGLALPLAALIVIGVGSLPWGAWLPALRSRARRRAVAVAGVAVLCVPGLVAHLWLLHSSVTSPTSPLIADDESRALDLLADDPRPGTVLAPVPTALLVPGLAGREVWSSGLGWTPRWKSRAIAVQDLFAGELSPPRARALVRDSGARFLLSDCRADRADIAPALGPVVSDVRQVGCARIYEVAGPPGAPAPVPR